MTHCRHSAGVTAPVVPLTSRITRHPETIRFFGYAPRKSGRASCRIVLCAGHARLIQSRPAQSDAVDTPLSSVLPSSFKALHPPRSPSPKIKKTPKAASRSWRFLFQNKERKNSKMASKRNLTTIAEFRFAKNAFSSPQAARPVGSKRNFAQITRFRFAKCAVSSLFSETQWLRSVKTKGTPQHIMKRSSPLFPTK